MRAHPAALLVPLLALAACGDDGEKKTRITRDRDAAAVVVVEKTPDGLDYADEAEPNDEAGAAQAMELPGGIRGNLDGDTDVDRYAIEVKEAGWLRTEVGGISDVDLILELQTGEGERIVRSDRGPDETAEGLPNYWLEPGSYVLAISEYVKRRRRRGKDPRTGPSPDYELSAKLVTDDPPRNHEREPNQEPTSAMELLLGVDGFGYVGWNDDADRWRLTFDGWGQDYSLDVDVTPVAGVKLRLSVLDDNGDPVITRRAGEGEAVAVRNLIPKKGHEHYYMEVSGKSSNPLERYAIRLSSRMLDLDMEREPNDEREQAVPMRSDAKESAGTRRGYLLAGDEDWYRLSSSLSATAVTVTLLPPAGLDAALSVYAGGELLAGGNAGKEGEQEEVADLAVPPGTELFVKVHGDGTAESIEPYDLRFTIAPQAKTPAPSPEPDYDPYEE